MNNYLYFPTRCLIIAMAALMVGWVGVVRADTPNSNGTATTQPSDSGSGVSTAPDIAPPAGSSDAEALKQLIGVNPSGPTPQALPKLPAMSLCGFIRRHDGKTCALLNIEDLKRTFLVEAGTEIPITVQGRIAPATPSELTGLDQNSNASPQPAQTDVQSQLLLKIINVGDDGVTVQAEPNDQTIVVR